MPNSGSSLCITRTNLTMLLGSSSLRAQRPPSQPGPLTMLEGPTWRRLGSHTRLYPDIKNLPPFRRPLHYPSQSGNRYNRHHDDGNENLTPFLIQTNLPASSVLRVGGCRKSPFWGLPAEPRGMVTRYCNCNALIITVLSP